jgi:hypothetical protein
VEKVAVEKPVLIGLVVALVAAIAAVAFLAGRQSAEPTPVVVEATHRLEAVTAPAAPPAPTGPTEADAPTQPAPAAAALHAREAEKPAPVTAVAPPDPVAPRIGVAAPAGNEAVEVAAYFDQIQAIQTESGAADGQAYAQQIITSAMQGDASGFQRLAQDLERSEGRARAITPPDPCKAYHASLLALLGESEAMIRTLERAFASKDVNAMTTVAESASRMQTRTEALQAEEKRLRRQYHLGEGG